MMRPPSKHVCLIAALFLVCSFAETARARPPEPPGPNDLPVLPATGQDDKTWWAGRLAQEKDLLRNHEQRLRKGQCVAVTLSVSKVVRLGGKTLLLGGAYRKEGAAALRSVLLISVDGGKTWRDTGAWVAYSETVDLYVADAKRAVALVCWSTQDPAAPARTFCTTDGGKNWIPSRRELFHLQDKSPFVHQWVIRGPLRSELVLSGSRGHLLRYTSVDGGRMWQSPANPYGGPKPFPQPTWQGTDLRADSSDRHKDVVRIQVSRAKAGSWANLGFLPHRYLANENDVCSVRRTNWPHRHPRMAPADKTLEKLTPRRLMPYVLAEKSVGGGDCTRLACAWFMWKTRGTAGEKLRAELADRIAKLLRAAEADPKRTPHNHVRQASFLGPLGARKHIRELLERPGRFDCCYGPTLVRALADCGRIDDVPALIAAADRESEGAGAIVNEALERLTGVKMPLKANGYTDKAAWQNWWQRNKKRTRPAALPAGRAGPQFRQLFHK